MLKTRSPLSVLLLLAVVTGCEPSAPFEDEPGDESGDPAGSQSCPEGPSDAFSWSWEFGSYQPEVDEDVNPSVDIWAPDSGRPLECVASSFGEVDDTLTLDLDCAAGGTPISQQQQLTLSPTPATLRADLEADVPLEVFFRPQPQCTNGCNFFYPAGWLAVRRADDGVLRLGIVDAERLLSPVDELAPLQLSTDVASCDQIADASGCDPEGWTRGLDLTVAVEGESQSIAYAGQASVGGYQVVLDTAVEGAFDGCSADGGERARIEVMAVAEE